MLFFIILSAVCLAGVNGISGQRIAGGDPVTIQSYPFAVALLTNSGSGAYSLGCGGTILTNRVILTAASCFYTNNLLDPVSWWRARVGTSYSNAGGTIHVLNQIVEHPNFNVETYDNDVAIVRPTLQLNLVPGSIEAARVAGGAYSFTVNSPVVAIGWGAVSAANNAPSSELRQVEVFVVNQQTCTNRYNEVNFVITDNMVCVGWLDVGVRGQCQGDYGSPILDSATGAVVGIFSRSEECAESGRYPGINTRLAPYVDWLLTVVYQ